MRLFKASGNSLDKHVVVEVYFGSADDGSAWSSHLLRVTEHEDLPVGVIGVSHLIQIILACWDFDWLVVVHQVPEDVGPQ